MDVLTPEERAAHNEEQGVGDTAKITYRHNRIARFSIEHAGHLFSFKDHILTIPTRLEDKFKEAYRHMLPQDQASIVKMRVIDNEAPVLDDSTKITSSTAVRGPVGTVSIPGKVVNDPAAKTQTAPLSPLAGLTGKPAA